MVSSVSSDDLKKRLPDRRLIQQPVKIANDHINPFVNYLFLRMRRI